MASKYTCTIHRIQKYIESPDYSYFDVSYSILKDGFVFHSSDVLDIPENEIQNCADLVKAEAMEKIAIYQAENTLQYLGEYDLEV